MPPPPPRSAARPGQANIYGDVIRLEPKQYIHVHDNNKNVTYVVTGPVTFTKQDHEQIVSPPSAMILIPPRCYCIIENPVMRDDKNNLITDRHGQAKVRLGDTEVRFEQQPFPLYPQESLQGDVQQLRILPVDTALRLRALRDFEDKKAGDEWLFEGPGTFYPRVEAQNVGEVKAQIVRPNTGLLLRARNACKDRTGVNRQAGEEWLYTKVGSYMPGVDEEVVKTVEGRILTERKALHLECLQAFQDPQGTQRQPGENWLVTINDTDVYIPGPNERVVGEVPLTTLSDRQFCVVLNPWKNGKHMLGQKEIRSGRCSFFLHPGESLERGIEDVFVLDENDALLLSANETFTDKGQGKDGQDVKRNAGDRWMIYGPRAYIPNTSVTVVERRKSLSLGENEGIYVRDTRSGQIRSVIGQTYMLAPDEELWEKPMDDRVLRLLASQGQHHHAFMEKKGRGKQGGRDASKVVTYAVPHNSVVQVYDFKSKKPRIVSGPDLVKLGPDEQFTVVNLSGGKPKRPKAIDTLSVFLGPDFMTDILVVETSDHARLQLQLAYNWFFDVDPTDETSAALVFNVPDFVGDACNAVASRVRAAVAAEPFDTFHKNSAIIIRTAVFGRDRATDEVRKELRFANNRLVINSVDIQSVEPVDQKTRDALMKSVQLAIEITTKSQEAGARHDAERREQAAKGELERQIISDKAKAEKERLSLLGLQAESAAIESTGTSKAEAKASAAAAQIEGESEVEQARLKADAQNIMAEIELKAEQEKANAEIEFQKSLNELEVIKAEEMAKVDVTKFRKTVHAIGRETIASMARAGPELQARMLKSLGLQGYLLTDGTSPINLMNTAQSLVAGGNL